ncbi:DUF2183 domain-containing protein [Croceicoccus ponticola]|uniref:DUF2183 domain-containing protein n=1 Tax=Croceicoccus ponticola TaxID=2217664 RepID=A0A437GYB6_9SPHN|nr:phosphatase domain-containing protein [Croceicoccus ponticola]RVQ67639.1 DUF2183 domain-containing protein [Croceicoccus ponticola]
MTRFGHPPSVFPFFGFRNADRLTITARALRAPPPSWEHRSDIAKFRALWSQFASREHGGLPVTLVLGAPDGTQTRHDAVGDDEGYARFDVELNDWGRPAHTAWETVRFEWINRDGPQSADGYVLAPGHDVTLGVISDIDDTIIETGITGGPRKVMRNWRRLLATMPGDRSEVPHAGALYGRLAGAVPTRPDADAGQRLPAPYRPFFYVSSSPWNLFSYLVSFMESRGLPLGPIQLRDWAFDRATLGSAGHGVHKRLAAEGLLATYPEMRFALIGDDTQGDLVAYSHLAADFPGRIAAIFIRKAGDPHTPEEIAAVARIEASGIPLWLGDGFDVGEEFLAQIGVSSHGDTAQIVDTIEEVAANT